LPATIELAEKALDQGARLGVAGRDAERTAAPDLA
jgi:hypothetical protein